jgi:DNA-binding CsgD family transcriptional regulator/tetratricopeptide (TPR) repeat protein
LDAEEANLQQALSWALRESRPLGLRLAVALAPWWHLRGRFTSGYELLASAVEGQADQGHVHDIAHVWLGLLARDTLDLDAAVHHYTCAVDGSSTDQASTILIDALDGRSAALRNLGRFEQAIDDASRALALAQGSGYLAGESLALRELATSASYVDDTETALRWAERVPPVGASTVPGWVSRSCDLALTQVLLNAGELDAAAARCDHLLAQSSETGDVSDHADALLHLASLALKANDSPSCAVHLAAALELADRCGALLTLIDVVEKCGYYCAAIRRPAEAVTLWSAYYTISGDAQLPDVPSDETRRRPELAKAEEELGPAAAEARERGTVMTFATAVEFARLQLTSTAVDVSEPKARGLLSPRESELVTLVAGGRTDGQIADELYISVRTVRSHLDRIRDKTGCRKRADLTRFALEANLV